MKNTYDILVNFKKRAYEFYEWNKNDDIKHVKTIPTFRVSNACLLDFYNSELLVSSEFLKKIEDKTEVFCKGIVKVEKYACVLFSDCKALAFTFDSNGNLTGKSNLLFDESDDIITSCFNLEESIIDYNIISVCNVTGNYTRKEYKIIESLLEYLKSIYENKGDFEIMYMYLECFDRGIKDEKKAYNELVKQVEMANFNVIEKLNDLIKVVKK